MQSMPKPDDATLVEIYRKMSLIRQNDEKVIRLLKSGQITMTYYSTAGQEVIPSAISVNLNIDDYICTIYRGIHDTVAKGVPLKKLWAEFAGRVNGTCKGKGGPMHITHPESGVMVTTGIVGSSMPIANGLAWASQLAGNSRVTIANFGDGASNIGAFHESLNLASLWNLPVIFVCQNNGYAEHTRYENGTSVEKIADRAASYNMPGFRVDGNDPVSMYGVARTAIERARKGEGPTLIEAMTYRFNGHVVGDQGKYMDKAERAEAIANDPLAKLRAHLISEKIMTSEELEVMESTIATELQEAVDYALGCDYPDIGELYRDVFAEESVLEARL